MDEQKKTSGSLALNSTPRVITIAPSTPVRDRKLRVAAYARVSSRSEDQLNSFAAQNAHYTELITANPEWEFVDVYADKGITGTSAEKRDDFQRLLADCRRRSIPISLVGMEIPFLFLRSPHPLQLIITFYSLYRGLIRFSYNNSIK